MLLCFFSFHGSHLKWKPITFQAAVYGIGVCAEFGGSVFRPLVGGGLLCSSLVACFCEYCCLHMDIEFFYSFSFSEALSRLDMVIRHPNALHSDNVMAYDNAVSALGKICQYHRDGIDATQVQKSIVFTFILCLIKNNQLWLVRDLTLLKVWNS